MCASSYCTTWSRSVICLGFAARYAASGLCCDPCVYPVLRKRWNKILLQCCWPQTLCTAALTGHGVVMWDEWEMAVGWRDEQRSTMERVCECGPPVVLILKIPLEQAFFFYVPVIHTLIVLQWTIAEPGIRLFNMAVLHAYVQSFILHFFFALL